VFVRHLWRYEERMRLDVVTSVCCTPCLTTTLHAARVTDPGDKNPGATSGAMITRQPRYSNVMTGLQYREGTCTENSY
jgi:hypothetical protein